jgi:predicted ABC-type ATPase
VSLAKERVAIRVSKGGHSIPPEVIERRYEKGLKGFNTYAQVANSWFIYDNSGADYELIAAYEKNEKNIFNFETCREIKGNESQSEKRKFGSENQNSS